MPVILTGRAKFARSLNCQKCQQPFSSTENEPRTPRTLLHSGHWLCQECFDGEKAKSSENRWHQCENGDECYSNPNPKYYVMELISLGSLALNSSKSGYILVKDFLAPECPVCHENYHTHDIRKTSMSLYCGHAICTECYQNKRKGTDDRGDIYKYSIECPICEAGTETSSLGGKGERNPLNDFLLELPGLVDEFDYVKYPKTKCTSCKKKIDTDDMFFCEDCDTEICGACVLRKHNTHKRVDLRIEKAKLLSEDVEKMTTNQIETYEDIFSQILKKVPDFKQKFKERIRRLVNIEDYDELNKKQAEYRKLGEKFVTISEEYLPSLRKFETKLEGILKKLSKLQTMN